MLIRLQNEKKILQDYMKPYNSYFEENTTYEEPSVAVVLKERRLQRERITNACIKI